MPNLGKEAERQLTPDEIALREIEGYLDKIEHQTETAQPQQSKAQGDVSAQTTPITTTMKPMPSQPPVATAGKIVLPLDKTEIEGGLGKGVLEGLRWLSEWCVMMIKKYPGRVFYMPPKLNQ